MTIKDFIKGHVKTESGGAQGLEKEAKISLNESHRFTKAVSATGLTGLVEYKPTSRFEEAIEEIVDAYLAEKRNVLIVSPATRTSRYAERFSESIIKGMTKLVKVTASAKTERFYKIEGAEKEDVEDWIVEISVDWLEYLSEVIEGLEKKSAIVFEPLSDIILINGFEKTFKFITKTIDYCIDQEIQLVCFINSDAHEENVRASFEGLFTKIASITDEKFDIIK